MSKNLYSKFDKMVMQIIVFAKAASVESKVDCIYPESFAVGLLTSGINPVTSSLSSMGIDLESCLKTSKMELRKKKTQNETNNSEPVGYTNLKLAKQFIDSCKMADDIRKEEDAPKINVIHMFMAFSYVSKNFSKIFEKEGVDIQELSKALKRIKEPAGFESRHRKPMKALEFFCTDVTKKAENNELDPIIAREKEIEQSITVLCRRNKNNPILLGEPGVGKTAIVEGIAQRVVSGTVPKQLRNHKIFSLNLSSLVAGTKYRGEFEERINALVREIQETKNCVLFIDEIHTLIGAGAASGGSLDASNILKPFLSKGDLRCIGATTNSEFKKYFEKDGALTRRFQEIRIEEPTKEQMFQILSGVKIKLEEYHECVISDEAIESAIYLSARYLSNKKFPDKAIECIDTACAKYAWANLDSSKNSKPIVMMKDIARVISETCKIPIEVIMWDNNERIIKIEETMFGRIIGQDDAVRRVCKVLKSSYSGIRNPERPIGCFVFGGQTGTGKTYMAKELAKAIFGRETSSFIRLDMSEFSEPHSISKLIGSPPGYVGFSDTEVFLDKVRRKPYSIVLLDEVEKAHPDVIKSFLQVMSDGIMTDCQGYKVDFKNVVMIMTGNFGMNTEEKNPIGFSGDKLQGIISKEQNRLIKYMEQRFGEEFVNRIDEAIPFIPLSREHLRTIVLMRLEEMAERIRDRNCKLKFDDSLVDFILSDSKAGHGKNAMLINRSISQIVEPCVSDALMEVGNDPYTISISAKDGEAICAKKKRYLKSR